jgi:tetratricopeptide (TPR) repeat protein
MITGVKNSMKLIMIAVITVTFVLITASLAGCRDEAVPVGSEKTEGEETIAEIEDLDQGKELAAEEDGQAGEEAGEEPASSGEDTMTEEAEAEEEVIEIPGEITEVIKVANDYFSQGLYAEAVGEYRDVARVIEDSDLPDDVKAELLGSIESNYQEAVNITDTARIHHSNAMNLMYEKRFEEAKAELEAALAIYPKYQTAIDALASLEALMGLE